ncbi:hypothetical protein LTR17_023831 [Elasticomyces elasticus]|nr:hypothetical protein LTR17_023831 [Elasticomyces elasticus]
MSGPKRKAVGKAGSRAAGGTYSAASRKRKDKADAREHEQEGAVRNTTRPFTRGMKIASTDSTRQAVFATAELLENIMLHLPARDIFCLQRVGRQFRDIVKTSIQLQRKLFIRPVFSTNTEVLAIRNDKLVLLPNANNLPQDLEARRGEPLVVRPATELNAILSRDVLPNHGAYLNPVLGMLGRKGGGECLALDCETATIDIIGNGSWKDTCFTNQPCNSARIRAQWHLGTFPHIITGSLVLQNASTADPQGFSLGSLVDAGFCDIKKSPSGEIEPYRYHDLTRAKGAWVGELRQHIGSALDLIRKLESVHGEKALLSLMEIKMHDVVVVNEKEQKEVLALRLKMEKALGGN